VSDVRIRPMTVDDATAAERVTALGFHELDIRMFRRSWPDPQLRPPERGQNWTTRAEHLVGTDPGGCWVAEGADGLLGVALSMVREQLWILVSDAVSPGAQGMGLGKALLQPALDYGQGCLRGLVNASSDPRALRRYHAAGFTFHPQMFLRGTPDRSTIPVIEKVREGNDGDIDLMDSVDRLTRGSAHGRPDHELMIRQCRLIVSDTTTGSGYAYVDDGVACLAATNRRTAQRLLWEAIATSEDVLVAHVSANNDWAVDVGLAARLELHQEGYLGVRGMAPPSPYLPHGALL
jgi:GNAT superfamily N-acetyltransferase